MKNIVAIILSIFILASCNSDYKKISKLEQELKKANSKQEEKRILNDLWSIAFNSDDIGLSVSAVDATGRNVITELQKAVEPVTVTITLSKKEDWVKIIEFVPKDIHNVFLLLRE